MRSVVWFGLIYLGIYVPALKRSLLDELMRIDHLGVWSKVHVELDGLGDHSPFLYQGVGTKWVFCGSPPRRAAKSMLPTQKILELGYVKVHDDNLVDRIKTA